MVIKPHFTQALVGRAPSTARQGGPWMSPSCQCRAVLLIPAGQPSAFPPSGLGELRSGRHTELLGQRHRHHCPPSTAPAEEPGDMCTLWRALSTPPGGTWQDMGCQHLAEAAAGRTKPARGYHTVCAAMPGCEPGTQNSLPGLSLPHAPGSVLFPVGLCNWFQ